MLTYSPLTTTTLLLLLLLLLVLVLLLPPENSMQTMLTTLREFNVTNITSIQKLYLCNIEGPELS